MNCTDTGFPKAQSCFLPPKSGIVLLFEARKRSKKGPVALLGLYSKLLVASKEDSE